MKIDISSFSAPVKNELIIALQTNEIDLDKIMQVANNTDKAIFLELIDSALEGIYEQFPFLYPIISKMKRQLK